MSDTIKDAVRTTVERCFNAGVQHSVDRIGLYRKALSEITTDPERAILYDTILEELTLFVAEGGERAAKDAS